MNCVENVSIHQLYEECLHTSTVWRMSPCMNCVRGNLRIVMNRLEEKPFALFQAIYVSQADNKTYPDKTINSLTWSQFDLKR